MNTPVSRTRRFLQGRGRTAEKLQLAGSPGLTRRPLPVRLEHPAQPPPDGLGRTPRFNIISTNWIGILWSGDALMYFGRHQGHGEFGTRGRRARGSARGHAAATRSHEIVAASRLTRLPGGRPRTARARGSRSDWRRRSAPCHRQRARLAWRCCQEASPSCAGTTVKADGVQRAVRGREWAFSLRLPVSTTPVRRADLRGCRPTP